MTGYLDRRTSGAAGRLGERVRVEDSIGAGDISQDGVHAAEQQDQVSGERGTGRHPHGLLLSAPSGGAIERPLLHGRHHLAL